MSFHSDSEPCLVPERHSCSLQANTGNTDPLLVHCEAEMPSPPHTDSLSSSDSESVSDNFGSQTSSLATPASIKISYDMTPYSSTMSSLHPLCRICHNSGEKTDILITPCRCVGTLHHVHGTCLRVTI